jgi:hypothetical protein
MMTLTRQRVAVGLCFCLLLYSFCAAASRERRPVRTLRNPAPFDQILRENALFFNMLVSFSYTTALADRYWDLDLKDINVNLLTREVRDDRGHQFVRVRVGGAVRANHNVELNVLDDTGSLVGKGFLGFDSGQLAFYDRNDKPVVTGYVDSRGYFELFDRRLPAGKQDLGYGGVDSCVYCSSMQYDWYDALGNEVGGGWMYPRYYGSDSNHVRMYWSFEYGNLDSTRPATGEAEYDLSRETTGAINSVLFDTSRTAASFFANPYSLLPEPAGKALLPRFTDQTGVAVTNTAGKEIVVTYIARRPDGGLVSGDGILNPSNYTFGIGQQFSAYPAEIFRDAADRRAVLGKGSVGWMEIFSDEGPLQAVFMEGNEAGTALDGNIGATGGSDPILFTGLRMGPSESTEIELLNLVFDDVMVRLELLDKRGAVLRDVGEFYIAGYGMRNFYLGGGSDFLRVTDPSAVGALRVSCNNSNSIRSTNCSSLTGLATYTDAFGSTATALAATVESAGTVLVGAHFADGGGWTTAVDVSKMDGNAAPVYLDLYDQAGVLMGIMQETVPAGGTVRFVPVGTGPGESPKTGYVRVRSDSGRVAGLVTITRQGTGGSVLSSYPLANYLSKTLQFNQVAEGVAGQIEYWTGLAIMNDFDRRVTVHVEVLGPDGVLDRTADVVLSPYEQRAILVRQLVGDPEYRRLDGYMRLTASDPVTAIVMYGDTASRFLSSVPSN